MGLRPYRWGWGIALALLVSPASTARAQYPSAPGSVNNGTYGAAGGMLANPYANPYLNPFLNPYMMQQSNPGAGNTLMYFMAAQQMNNGLGSGRLSGARGAGMMPPAPVRQESQAPRGVPSGKAARYFNRTTAATAGVSQYYNRPNSYFPKSNH